MSESLLKTPLNNFHIANNARMVPFAGWEMPVQYTSILEEHKAVREKVGLFDVSHMGEISVKGAEALVVLDRLLTNDPALLKPGKAIYSPMCYSDGGVVDDVIVYQRSEEEFLVCVNAANTEKDFEWMTEQAVGFRCVIENVSADFGQLALQGPNAIELAETSLGLDLKELKRFHFIETDISGAHCMVSRTGYTGEDGIEIYCPTASTPDIAKKLVEAGDSFGLALTGLGCRDSLRLEVGYPLYGHEIDSTIDPLTGGLAWAVKLKRESKFVGKKALLEKKEAGLESKVVYFVMEDRRIARAGDSVKDSTGKSVGKVLSGTQSPILGKPIGSALVQLSALEQSGPLSVELRGKTYAIQVKKPPLHL